MECTKMFTRLVGLPRRSPAGNRDRINAVARRAAQVIAFMLCIIAKPTFAVAPTITSFSPILGPVGTAVTIVGTNFS